MARSEEEYKDLLSRYNSLVMATIKHSEILEKVRAELQGLKNENARLGAELKAAQANAQLLGDDANFRSQEAGIEIQRLRELCKNNGISPEV
jgi:hypothetical protein